MAFYGTLGDIDLTSTDYPSIQPTLDLNFAKSKALDPRITFYRNSLATYVDDKGIIHTVPENVPRFDHDPTTGESLGLLIEESRTNIALYSQALNNSSVWGQYASTVSQDSTISPSGQSDAYKITLGTSPSGAYQGIIQGITLSTSNYYTFSCFVKAGTQSIITVSESFSFGYTITANLLTKQITSNGGYVVSQGIQEYPNGWFRIHGVWDLRTISTTTYTVWDINLGTNSTSGIYCYAWGAQLEAGSFPTSYIPTSGSAVTRAGDVCYVDGTNFNSWYNQYEGTFYSNFRTNYDSANGRVFRVSNAITAANNRIDYVATSQYHPYIETGAVVQTSIDAGDLPANTSHKIAVGLSFNGASSTINGGSVVSSGAITLPTSNRLEIGGTDGGGTTFLNGTMSRFSYYPKRLTNLQLQNLTA